MNSSDLAAIKRLEPDNALIIKGLTGDRINSHDQLREQIKIVIVLVGIKVPPDDLMIAVCFNMLKTHYFEITRQNFVNAFELNIAGSYPKKIEHYQSFNADYMSSILNLFKDKVAIAKSEMNKSKVAVRPEPVESTPKESYDELIKYIEAEKQVPGYWDWNKIYFHLETTGEINLTVAEKKELYENVKKQIASKKCINKYELKQLQHDLGELNLQTQCRKIIVLNHLKA